MIAFLLTAAVALLLGFAAGACYEAVRRGGSLDLRSRVGEVTAQRDQVVQLLARNPGHVHIHTADPSADRIVSTLREVAARA